VESRAHGGQGPSGDEDGVQQEYGTANAVYSFIQEQLGVRWLWPEEEDVIIRDSIAIAPMERRYAPSIRSRSGNVDENVLGDNKESGEELLGAVPAGAARLHGHLRRTWFRGLVGEVWRGASRLLRRRAGRHAHGG